MSATTILYPNSRQPLLKQTTFKCLQCRWLYITVVSYLCMGNAVLLKSQVNDTVPASAHKRIENSSSAQTQSNKCYLPVYFNYSKRLLKYNGIQKMDGAGFLNMCRGIKDSLVQQQVERFDAYTFQKQKLGLTALASGFSAFGILGGAASNGQGNNELNASLVCVGVLSILAVPVIAIYSGVPHRRRKAVLFRDLPIAYNRYVESQQTNCDSSALITY